METFETSWRRWGTYALLNLQDVAVLAVVTRILTLTDDISELIKQCGHVLERPLLPAAAASFPLFHLRLSGITEINATSAGSKVKPCTAPASSR